MLIRFSRALTLAALLLLPLLAGAAPKIFYTDIINGPKTGGLNNLGAFLTIFGAGFGATQGTSTVTINNAAVGAVIQWSDAKITVQPGPAVSTGAIKVTVGGAGSNTDQIFTVNSANIYFVSLTGSDATGAVNDITKPFRNIQNVLDNKIAPGGAGGHVVIRGGTWSDNFSRFDSFFSIVDQSGTATSPIVVMGYPTETVTFLQTVQGKGFHSFNTAGHYVLANLHLNANSHGINISIAPGLTDVRIANNEVMNYLEDGGGAAVIDGSGTNFRILGNFLHNNGGSKLYHAIYFDGRAGTSGDIEIAYNTIANQIGGRAVQIFSDTTTVITNVRVHHNLIHDISLDGIHFADNTGAGFQAYDNVVYNTDNPALRGPFTDTGDSGGCIRFVSSVLVALVYNNTFSNCNMSGSVDSGGIRFQNASSVTLINNIVNGKYFVNLDGLPVTPLSAPNNLWFGGGAAPPFATNSQTGDPMFVSAAAGNFRLLAGSAAIDNGSAAVNALVTTDFDGNPRPQGTAPDIGAFESSGVTLPTPTNLQVIKQ